MSVINIRGTSGSGKTWIVRQILRNHDHEEIRQDGKVVGYNMLNGLVFVAGRYTETGGGCDGFKGGARQTTKIVRQYHSQYEHVLFEGLMMSHLYQRSVDLADDLAPTYFLFLNTPMATCISRVRKRRREKGNFKEFDPHRTLIPDYKIVRDRVKPKLLEAGYLVETLDYRDPLPRVLELLELPECL